MRVILYLDKPANRSSLDLLELIKDRGSLLQMYLFSFTIQLQGIITMSRGTKHTSKAKVSPALVL